MVSLLESFSKNVEYATKPILRLLAIYFIVAINCVLEC